MPYKYQYTIHSSQNNQGFSNNFMKNYNIQFKFFIFDCIIDFKSFDPAYEIEFMPATRSCHVEYSLQSK